MRWLLIILVACTLVSALPVHQQKSGAEQLRFAAAETHAHTTAETKADAAAEAKAENEQQQQLQHNAQTQTQLPTIVYIRPEIGHIFTLEVDPHCTVKQIKQDIHAQKGFPVDSQCLVCVFLFVLLLLVCFFVILCPRFCFCSCFCFCFCFCAALSQCVLCVCAVQFFNDKELSDSRTLTSYGLKHVARLNLKTLGRGFRFAAADAAALAETEEKRENWCYVCVFFFCFPLHFLVLFYAIAAGTG